MAQVDRHDPLFDTTQKWLGRIHALEKYKFDASRGRAVGKAPSVYLSVKSGAGCVRHEGHPARVVEFVATDGKSYSGNPFVPVSLGHHGIRNRNPFTGTVAIFQKMHMTVADNGSGVWMRYPDDKEWSVRFGGSMRTQAARERVRASDLPLLFPQPGGQP